MATNKPEKHEFKAEVQQLLDIVVHSLYTDKEIFVRELVSNASDALEKLRHFQLTKKEIFDDDLPLEINITTDDTACTITFQDFGVGMTRAELAQNLGTIAHSGSQAFLNAVKAGAEARDQLIGQFGVGFYSAFMVAKKVSVFTHSWKKSGTHLVWTSDGSGSYEIETIKGQHRGCKVVIHLQDEAKEFSRSSQIKEILQRYSNFVQFPINLNGERINTIQAIWLRGKNEIKEEEYTEFYKFQANAFDEPLFRLHFNADAPLAINALLFVPKENTERWGFGRIDTGISLYCKKVMIDAKPEGLMPEWLRFLKGVVDSADLPLNISREKMQDSALVRKLNTVLTRRFLKFLAEEAKKRPKKFEDFYRKFGIFLKEGVTLDFSNKEQLAKLLRFESSFTKKAQYTSLDDYTSRMQKDQKEIYFLHGQSREQIETGPYLEAFKPGSLEVLYLYEPIDEFVMSHLGEFDGKKFVSADQADLKVDAVTEKKKSKPLSAEKTKKLCEWLKEVLGERINTVNPSKRLVESPAIALNADKFISPGMRRIMKSMRQEVTANPDINLEINPHHKLIKNLAGLKETDEALAKQVAEQIHDNALIAAGYLEDPRGMVNRVYDLLERVSGK